MKKIAIALLILSLGVFFDAQAWAHRIGGFGMGGHVGGFHGGVGRFGHPRVSHLGRFGHHRHFHHEQFFGPHHHFGPFVPPGHERHFAHEQFFGPHHHFGHRGFGFRSFGVPWGFGSSFFFGFSGGDFSSRSWFGPAGPPPLGAPGAPPLSAPGSAPSAPLGPPLVVISSPFFCFPHRLGFADQSQFLDHLQQFHNIPPRSAFSFCRPVGGGLRWIFFGF